MAGFTTCPYMSVLWSWFFSSSFPIDPSIVCMCREQLLLIILFPMLSKPGFSEVAFLWTFRTSNSFLETLQFFSALGLLLLYSVSFYGCIVLVTVVTCFSCPALTLPADEFLMMQFDSVTLCFSINALMISFQSSSWIFQPSLMWLMPLNFN